MAETYASLTTSSFSKPVIIAWIEGIPAALSGLGAASKELRLCTTIPAWASALVQYKAWIASDREGRPWVRALTEQIDPVQGRTSIGSLTVGVLDATDYLTTLFAVGKAAAVARFTVNIVAAASGAVTTVTVTDTTVFTVGKPYFIGMETLVCKQINIGTVDFWRGMFGSTGAAHTTSGAAKHDDDIYDHPRLWRGRVLHLELNYDHADLSESATGRPAWLFRLDGVKLANDLNTWEITATSAIGMLDRSIGLQRWTGGFTAANFPGNANADGIVQAFPAQIQEAPALAYPTVSARNLLRVGDELLDADVLRDVGSGIYDLTIRDRGIYGTDPAGLPAPGFWFGVDVPAGRVAEVLLSDPGRDSPRVGYKDPPGGALTASAHPLDLVLDLVLSTGDGTNYSGARSWDVLARAWGLGLPVARVDVTGIRKLAETYPLARARMPGFVLGWESPFRLREWSEGQILAILGLAWAPRNNGTIGLVRLTDALPFDGSTTIGAADTLPLTQDLDLDVTVPFGRISIEVESLAGLPLRAEALNVLARERFPEEERELKLKTQGLQGDGVDLALAASREVALVRRLDRPRPRVSLRTGWQHHLRQAGDVVTLTDAALPDDLLAARGITGRKFRVLGRELDFSRFEVGFLLEFAESANLGHVAPAARVTAWDGGTLTATVAANDFTPTDGDDDPIPSTDAAAFEVNYAVTLMDQDGAARSDNLVRVTVVGANALTVNTGFTSGGGPVTPAAGDTIVLMTYGATLHAAIGGSVSSEVLNYVWIADDADGKIVNLRAAYKYAE